MKTFRRAPANGRWVIALVCGCAVLASPLAASAWWAAGHMIVARIAFDQLSPEARRQMMAILAAHPQMGEWRQHLDFAPPGQSDCFLFMRASTWPDEINKDKGNPYAHPASRAVADRQLVLAAFRLARLLQDGDGVRP